ncbi:hypothetical protein BDV18DRAFT_154725 [Aspergillus unguis]
MASSQSRDQDHADCRRVRDLYSHFQLERSVFLDSVPTVSGANLTSLPRFPSNAEEPLLPASSTRVSPQLTASTADLLPEALIFGERNATLTSFTQLAAARLNVERVFIGVSDRDSLFVLAQSSKDLLGIEKPYELADDGTFGGCRTLPTSAWTMCKNTINLPPGSRERGGHHFLEISDLSQDDRYKSLPFVKDSPHFRFYAGTPLTSHTNINIGCVFLLDTKPHDGLTEEGKGILSSLSALTMNFLNVSRQALEGQRAARLSRGLSCFVEGGCSFVDSALDLSVASPLAQRSDDPPLASPNSLPLNKSYSSKAPSPSSISNSRSDIFGSSCPSEWTPGSHRKDRTGQAQLNGDQWIFKRAANLIRESLELDDGGGVVFLDVGNAPETNVDSSYDYSAENSTPVSVIAMSTNNEPFAPAPGSTVGPPTANIDTMFLQQLIRRYSQGKVWSFHRDGISSSSDDEQTGFSRSCSASTKSLGSEKNGQKKWKYIENSVLNLHFPDATQVIFIPIWNVASSRWFAGCFCWTTVETQVFSASIELSSLLGFGSSIMVEYSRLESLKADRERGDFISSISHELRSPLHGILAAAEFLSGTNLDEFQDSLLETINACGQTLLDTMNQVLDFGQIVSLERKSRRLRQDNERSCRGSSNNHLNGLGKNMPTDLAILAEEVVEGVRLGQEYRQRFFSNSTRAADAPRVDRGSPAQSQADVEVTVDIVQNDWVYNTQPEALRRIIMNIFGNAIKYTETGRVSLRLEVTDTSQSRHVQLAEHLVILTVSDTGKGISAGFLRSRLFTPFAQEDTLAVGTGLGLSIVQSLVRSMRGTINIQSQPGEGTVVKVTLPVTRPRDDVKTIRPTMSDIQFVQSAMVQRSPSHGNVLRGRQNKIRAAILGMEAVHATRHPRWSIISSYLTDWYNIELASWPPQAPVDILLADADMLAMNQLPHCTTHFSALLVICSRAIDYDAARSQYSPLADMVSVVTRPCGPHKLARAIRRCLTSRDLSTVPSFAPNFRGAASSSIPGLMGSAPSLILSPISVIAPHSSSGSSPTIVSKTATSERHPRVLVVDDNIINPNLLLTFLSKRRLTRLDFAVNGQLAVDAMGRMPQGYDLIFMDISMPVMNGFKATRAIRAVEMGRKSEGGFASGIDHFLTKPVSFTVVSKLLDDWEARRNDAAPVSFRQ